MFSLLFFRTQWLCHILQVIYGNYVTKANSAVKLNLPMCLISITAFRHKGNWRSSSTNSWYLHLYSSAWLHYHLGKCPRNTLNYGWTSNSRGPPVPPVHRLCSTQQSALHILTHKPNSRSFLFVKYKQARLTHVQRFDSLDFMEHKIWLRVRHSSRWMGSFETVQCARIFSPNSSFSTILSHTSQKKPNILHKFIFKMRVYILPVTKILPWNLKM